MDFDEYEYLEKTVENPVPHKFKDAANGGNEPVKSGKKDRSRSSRHKGDGDDDDDYVDRKSKGSKSGDDLRDTDRRREKGSSRHRSRSREGERNEKDRDMHRRGRENRDVDRERNERNRRHREQGRDKERGHERVHDRDSEQKERDRDKGIEKDRNERARRSRSHSDRHQDDRERSRDMELGERSRDREYRERSRDRALHEKESRRHKEKKEEAAEPEVDPERDQRTVFAYQLPLRADERDIFEFFSRAGKVRDVRLIMDRNSRRSKGVGYIEFYDVMSVPMAIALSGQPIRGQPVMVKPSEAEKNLVQSTSTAGAGAAGLTGSGPARKLYVGNLIPNITEDQLRVVFESFGTIELVQLPRDETGLCKGFAFIQFARLEDAKAAQSLNGQLDIGGRLIKVSAVTDQPGMQDAGATGDLDDDEGGGLALNASSRAILMQKLDRSGAASSISGSLASPAVESSGLPAASAPNLVTIAGVSPLVQASVPSLRGLHSAGLAVPSVAIPTADSIGVPSECLLLKNMFDPKLETEPDFHLDIKDDVQDECAKFGTLKHIFVDNKNSEGFVYLRFDNTQAAMNAQRALHGRWFAGKMIYAIFMLPQDYVAKFPESR